MRSDYKIAVGDLFLIPIDDTRNAIGQVVARYGTTELFYLAALDHVLASGCKPLPVDSVSFMPILFVANTFDALLAAGVALQQRQAG